MARHRAQRGAPANPRRGDFFRFAGMVGAATGASRAPTFASRSLGAAVSATDAQRTAGLTFLRTDEAEFLRAETARLIPGDPESPGALEADVTHFIDQALASPWGNGQGVCTSGPWQEGTPQQDYQLKFTPAALYRTALAAVNRDLSNTGTPFPQMSSANQDAYLAKLEAGDHDLDGVPSGVFFDMLLENTIEGYLVDPIYGGNRDMVGWKAIGFPGAFAS